MTKTFPVDVKREAGFQLDIELAKKKLKEIGG